MTITITLLIDGKEKIFNAPFISTRRLKETLALSEKIYNGITIETIDEVAEHLVEIYGNQFTIDELYDGFPANEFANKAIEDMQRVLGNFEDKIKN
ncbi:hypothetical protein FDB72_17570 [Clostridium botulinum]|uniref:Phage protein n=1 Tax=Clostridium botulinum (strain Langeland / NCTC 10281 / Type F) TaxID=441772 RepID=A7GI63_CLOBL|nr:hypothetical protein [Clostridium botulinum]ABS39322.1 conserved hypothetical protein [Clostridium botulinum F str. Langeland]ADG00836.1 conserved hypothetical protein [Clostridium botulinum F str. 230613]MBY6794367.1 hypothetical protein [Clostridium botulinum]MBY6938155.1 hypothetical protein [Clostridium botulinum]MBY6944944.1 hypothetical protein [Clostridium botulinum]